MIKIYDASDITEAHIVCGMLRAHDIQAHVGGHYLQGGIGELMVQGFAAVFVEDDEFASARRLVEAYERGGH
ncbi:hypothetical protein MNBD_GAMMA13-406 [hydrothermal vent metagenome]|uniref:DUF2007 domain-containing protein n=1 Tax=hydrothermal vent metagenome TaxID=652676 RepID=A0A3B0YXC3_9ZZZZ